MTLAAVHCGDFLPAARYKPGDAFDFYHDEKVFTIYVIDDEFFCQLLDDLDAEYKDLSLRELYVTKGSRGWTAIDHRAGEAYTEDFHSLKHAVWWLVDKISYEDYLTDNPRRIEERLGAVA